MSSEKPGLAAGALAVLLLAVVGLHVFEPELSITWSYAHLGRDVWRVVVALALTVALPVLMGGAWRSSGWRARSTSPRGRRSRR